MNATALYQIDRHYTIYSNSLRFYYGLQSMKICLNFVDDNTKDTKEHSIVVTNVVFEFL